MLEHGSHSYNIADGSQQGIYDQTPLKTLPPEIMELIFEKLDYTSPQFTLHYANIISALSCYSTEVIYPHLCHELKNKFFLLNLTSTPGDEIMTPLISKLKTPGNNNFKVDTDPQHNFTLERNELRLSPNSPFKKIIYITDESTINENIKIPIFQRPVDLIFIPKTPCTSVIPLLQGLPPGITINNLIFDSMSDKLNLGKKMFGIYDFDFFSFRQNNAADEFPDAMNDTFRWLRPRIQQISFPGITELQIDYMMIDSFIYDILQTLNQMFPHLTNITSNSGTTTRSTSPQRGSNEDLIVHGETCTNSILRQFFKDVKIYFPDLVSIEFIKFNGQETCNFIDLSTLMLSKFKNARVNLIDLFQIHSLKNWSFPKLQFFTGHRFKFDETTMTGSQERHNSSLIDNLHLLHEMISTETQDATSYFRINLIPEGVKSTKILNWIPFDLDGKPFFCLKSKTLNYLELKFLNGFTSLKTISIQGLYLPNLTKLLLNNDKLKSFRPIISDKRNSIVMINSIETKDEFIPVEFSYWNDLKKCEKITFTTSTEQCSSNLGAESCSHSNYIFNIKNLKCTLPNLNLKESFSNYYDERQKFIVV